MGKHDSPSFAGNQYIFTVRTVPTGVRTRVTVRRV